MSWPGPRVPIAQWLTDAVIPFTDHDRPGYGTPLNPSIATGSTTYEFEPGFIVVHYPVGIDDDGPDSILELILRGHPRAPAPIYQLYIDHAAGAWPHLISEGRANQAGNGARVQRDRALADLPVLPPPATDDIGGNRWSIGISLEGPPTTSEQRERCAQVAAAICQGAGWTANRVLGHKEWTSRKRDPDFAGDWLRERVAELLEGDAMPDPRLTDAEVQTLKDIHRGIAAANESFPPDDQTSAFGIGAHVTRTIRQHTRKPGSGYDHVATPQGTSSAAALAALDAALAAHIGQHPPPSGAFTAAISPKKEQ